MITARHLLQFLFVLINEGLIFYFVYKASEVKPGSNLKIFIIVFIASILISLNNIYSANELRLVGNYLIGLLMFVIAKNDFKKLVFYYSLIMLFGIFAELILSIILSTFLVSIKNLAFFLQPLFVLATYFVWFGGWTFVISLRKVKYILSKMEDALVNAFKVEFIIVILFLIIDIIVVKHYFDLKGHFLLLASMLALNLLFVLILVILKKQLKLKTLEISNNYLKSNIDLYEKVINDHNIMKHNLISDLMIIKSVSNSRSQKIIDEKIKSYKDGYSWISDINDLPEGLRGLICLKITEAKKHGVDLISEYLGAKSYNVSKKLSAKTYLDLCERLDIIINNAIEAAALCQNKIIKITVIIKKDKTILIDVANPFSNEIDFSKFGQENSSTKMRNSGYGLYYLFKNASKKIKIKFEIINDIYMTHIMVDIKNIANK